MSDQSNSGQPNSGQPNSGQPEKSAPPAKTDVLRTTDDEARALARGLIRASGVATLATLDADGAPLATLTAMATDADGSPVILVSQLSSHTQNLARDPRLSLLCGRLGKGDPLAHPRISLSGRARRVDRASAEGERVRRRFLARNPKAQLYVDFPDFLFLAVSMSGASLNGGFGKAYELTRDDLATSLADADDLIAAEAEIIAHMNEDHADAVALYAAHHARREAGSGAGAWRMISLDPDGFEVAAGGDIARIAFGRRVTTAEAARVELIRLAKAARKGADGASPATQ
jgi:hypothetical protein